VSTFRAHKIYLSLDDKRLLSSIDCSLMSENHDTAITTPVLKNSENGEDDDGVLANIIRDNSIFLGGSSFGKGFRRAARYYLRKEAPVKLQMTSFPGAEAMLKPGVDHRVEESFYVVDIGLVVSQLYQWREYFPRVEAFYAIKCNPDPVIVETLVTLGCSFDCASRNEMRLVQNVAAKLGVKQPDIIFANPCKPRSHIIEAVCRNVTLMTFDNEAEVKKCASISNKIQLILRIITDDSGSQCRLSSKFGAPKSSWRPLLSAAKAHGLSVVGVSFHVGSGCRDSTRYAMALRDARELFDLAEAEYGFKMTVLDIGGGFPGETHSLWNPASVFGDPTAEEPIPEFTKRKYTIDEEIDFDESTEIEAEGKKEKDTEVTEFMYFSEIAAAVVPIIDELFPPNSGVRIIAEPGRYLVAASATLCTSVVSIRSNATSDVVPLLKISDEQAAFHVDQVTRAEEDLIVADQSQANHPVIDSIVDEIAAYSEMYARLNLNQQEFDVYAEKAELTSDDLQAGAHPLGPPEDRIMDGQTVEKYHSVEGMQMGIVADCYDDGISVVSEQEESDGGGMKSFLDNYADHAGLSLAAAGEAAISGVVIQAIADSAPHQDDYAYYISDGCYGGFNNLIFDHATVRPRRLKNAINKSHRIVTTVENGISTLEAVEELESDEESDKEKDDGLYPSTVFGPTCDSIDVVARSVLLPKMSMGDWLYFQNMGAYTSAAASDFNGFTPSDKFYVCSVQPEHFENFKALRNNIDDIEEEKKHEDY
jgi:ornithine decarboxylase